MKTKLSILILSLLSLGLMGCTTDTTTVQKGNNVTVDYVGKLPDGTVFDTSKEDVAKEHGKYTTGRNYDEGLSFTVGAGQMIAGFDQGVEGMKVGETKTVTIKPEDAYGARSEQNLITITKDKIPEADKYKIGDKVMSAYGQAFTVYKINDKDIVFDANHELAGKTLIFDITIKSIQQ